MGGWGRNNKASASTARRGKKAAATRSEGEGDVEAEGGRNFWIVEHMVALIKAKQDQNVHLQGMGHPYARMKPREGKSADVHERLKKGVDRTTDKCGKKQDNLMQQFKKVHLFQGDSGKQDFFQLMGKERSVNGFSLTMDRAVYEEIKAPTAKSHTIHPKNVADTGDSGGVQLPSACSGGPESVDDGEGGGDGNEEEDNSTKGSSPTTGSPGGFGKRKNMRQQTFEALTECMEKHGTLMATTMESASKRQCSIQIRQCETMEAELEGIEAVTRLCVDDMRFWNETEGNGLFKLIQEVRLYLLPMAKGVPHPNIRRSIVLPHSNIQQHKIEDESQLKATKDRGIKVQSIALRVIRGWIFKSTSCSRGYHSPYRYVLNHMVTNIVRAMWFGEDRRTCVSPAVRPITLEMDMMLPIWFVWAHIEDKHKDDELASYQEVTLQRLVGAFMSAITLAEGIDGGCVSYDRLKNTAEVMRVLLAATMWLMRMSRDDLRSHFDASLFVQLTVKPTLVASLHHSFDAPRHILQAATVVMERMGKPSMTLADPPLYIPNWAFCGITFEHDATLPL
ncbi:hypothetical protein CBR_g30988 [Chara braunii]|uniref:Uncharacterized protein n=1 Tax=Chara braunii TaxID=69332 RepID=A0A388LE32_CHABU|nr:hypothetical protein CBR_g30988 [Chara braunii]|eukprot:GBG80527.1 hypothetical protein CBR_g30988 [Chara braunii]